MFGGAKRGHRHRCGARCQSPLPSLPRSPWQRKTRGSGESGAFGLSIWVFMVGAGAGNEFPERQSGNKLPHSKARGMWCARNSAAFAPTSKKRLKVAPGGRFSWRENDSTPPKRVWGAPPTTLLKNAPCASHFIRSEQSLLYPSTDSG